MNTPVSQRPSSSMASSGSTPLSHIQNGITALLLLVACAASIYAVTSPPYLPSLDGPQHLYLGHLLNHFSDPGAPYPRFYRPTLPLTSWGFLFLYAPLMSWLGWQTALRVILGLTALLWGGGMSLLAARLNPRRTILGAFGFVLALQWAMYMGFFSFVIASGLGMVILAIALGPAPWSRPRAASIGGLLLLQAVGHIFAAQLTGIALIALVIARTTRRDLKRNALTIVLVGLPAFALNIVSALSLAHQMPSLAPGTHPTNIGPGVATKFTKCFLGGPWWHSLALPTIAVIGAGWALVTYRNHKHSRQSVGLIGAGALFLVLGLVLPMNLEPYWQFFSPRFFPLAVGLLLVTIPLERVGRRAFAASALGITFVTLASSTWSTTLHRHLWGAFRPALTVLSKPLKAPGLRLPIILDTWGSLRHDPFGTSFLKIEPQFNEGKLFAVAQGGIVPYTFTAIPAMHPFVIDRLGQSLFPPVPRRRLLSSLYERALVDKNQPKALEMLTRYAQAGSRYDGVILQERTSEHLLFQQRGYAVDAHAGHTWTMRFVGCPTRLTIHNATVPSKVPVSVRFAWAPLRDVWQKVAVQPSGSTTGTFEATLPTPCGRSFVLIHQVLKGTGGHVSSTRTCTENAHDQTLHVNAKLRGSVVECTLRQTRQRPAAKQ